MSLVSVMPARFAQHHLFVYLINIYRSYVYCLNIYCVNIYNPNLLNLCRVRGRYRGSVAACWRSLRLRNRGFIDGSPFGSA
jgi:hypothetical protein